MNKKQYKSELRKLQIELIKMQSWVQKNRKRILIIFEGRDTAGKGGAIFRYTRYLNPRAIRIVALPKPTEVEKGQWYFQRYIKELPNPGEIVFFDRSWYNRAVVEPVMSYCTAEHYDRFMDQVPVFEKMLCDDGIVMIKFWFSIDIQEQKNRLQARSSDPLKQWKLSTVDMQAQKHWHKFTKYKEMMFAKTHRNESPWVIIRGNDKQKARLESIRYVLSKVDYPDKTTDALSLVTDPEIIATYSPHELIDK